MRENAAKVYEMKSGTEKADGDRSFITSHSPRQ